MQLSFSQHTDSIKAIRHFSGTITATNNGISLLPNFSLGRPAALFDLSLGKGRLSFDPMLRFAMSGKPWAFIFWWRYKLIKTKHFAVNIGAHPSFVFRSVKLSSNGIAKDYTTTQRYLAGETTPTYSFNKNIGIGIHYLYSHGLQQDAIQHTHYLALRSIMSDIRLTKQFALTVIPQFYYLSMDTKAGIYTSSSFLLTFKKFPVSLSSIISKSFKTSIAGKGFVWNIGLAYIFNKTYIPQ